MLSSFRAQNFRCFRELNVQNLGRINLFGGHNNVGKTALLEAISLLTSDGNPNWVYRILGFRGLGRVTGTPHQKAEWIWRPLFHDFDVARSVSIESTDQAGVEARLGISLRPRSSMAVQVHDGSSGNRVDINAGSAGLASYELVLNHSRSQIEFVMSVEANGEVRNTPAAFTAKHPSYFLAARAPNPLEEDGQLFGNLRIEKSTFDLLPVLQILEPRLRSLDVFPSPTGLILYGDVGLSRMQPLGMLGDGLARLTSILLRIATAPNGYVVIDEIENGFHHSVLTEIWRAISAAAEANDTQIFATTHSLEVIRAAQDANEVGPPFDLRYLRLQRRQSGEIVTVGYEPNELAAVAATDDIEVR